jgi:hypothetical protein
VSTICKICGRPLGDVRIQEHHLIPKTFKGKELISLHQICHQKIHATFSERELANYYHTPERIMENEEMVKFVKWVQKKSPEYYDKNDDTAHRKRKRR